MPLSRFRRGLCLLLIEFLGKDTHAHSIWVTFAILERCLLHCLVVAVRVRQQAAQPVYTTMKREAPWSDHDQSHEWLDLLFWKKNALRLKRINRISASVSLAEC